MLLKNSLLAIVVWSLCTVSIPSAARGQASSTAPVSVPLFAPDSTTSLTPILSLRRSERHPEIIPPLALQSLATTRFAPAPKPSLLFLPNARFTRDFGFIDHLEASVTLMDTPFAEQVHLPVASLWGGRMKLRGFESTITTADILWGLPGAGSWQVLHMGGRSFYAVRIPQEAQAYGMYLALHFHGNPTEPGDNAVVHGVGRVLHASRDFFHP